MKTPTGRELYLEYLKTSHWRLLRQAVLIRDSFKCTRCGSKKRLQAHHMFYRSRWEDSQTGDMVTLCDFHHRAEHGIGKVNQRPHSRRKRSRVTGKFMPGNLKSHQKKKWKILNGKGSWRSKLERLGCSH